MRMSEDSERKNYHLTHDLLPELSILSDDARKIAGPLLNELASRELLTAEDVTPVIIPARDRAKVEALLHKANHKVGPNWLADRLLPAPELRERTIELESFKNTLAELLGLRKSFEELPVAIKTALLGGLAKQEKLSSVMVEIIFKKTKHIRREAIRDLLEKGFLLEDLSAFYCQVVAVTGGDQAESEADWQRALLADAVYIDTPITKTITKMVSAEAYRLLQTSRLLGLVPLSVIKQLREMPIRVVGASAAAPLINLLVRLGAENIVWVDSGKTDGAKDPMLNTAGFEGFGQYKSIMVLQRAYQQNPFGHFVGLVGRVRAELKDKQANSEDLTFEELLAWGGKTAGLVIEVADDSVIKTQLRLWMQRHYPEVPLGWLADVNQPFAGLEKPGEGTPFNRHLPELEIARMAKPAVDRSAAFYETLRSVVMMLRTQFPTEHQLTFILFLQKILSFWPQTPLAAQESSTILAKLILKHLQSNSVMGSNVTTDQAPKQFVTFSDKDEATMEQLMDQLFMLPPTL